MEVDPKTMSLDALIAKDKGTKKPGQESARGGRAQRGRGGVRDKQGGRRNANEAKPNNRRDNFRARKTGNMISKNKGGDERMSNQQQRPRQSGGNFKVSRLLPYLTMILFVRLLVLCIGKHFLNEMRINQNHFIELGSQSFLNFHRFAHFTLIGGNHY